MARNIIIICDLAKVLPVLGFNLNSKLLLIKIYFAAIRCKSFFRMPFNQILHKTLFSMTKNTHK